MSTSAPKPYAPTRWAGDLLFTSGHIGRCADGTLSDGIVAQTRQTLENIEASLALQGLARMHIVRATVYLSDMALWAEMNVPYREFFGAVLPARSAVSVGLPPGVLVEIDAVATRASAGSLI